MKKTTTLEEILNFNFAEELDLSALPQEEQDTFNENLFGSFIERLIKRTTENFTENEQKEILEMIHSEEDLEKIFSRISENNENFVEEAGEEFIEFKSDIYELLN